MLPMPKPPLPDRRVGVWLPVLALAFILSACEPPVPSGSEPQALRSVARDPAGMVVSGSPAATRAGAEILGIDGNAVDAAVATAFALAVAEPTQSGLGGRTQGLVRMANGETYGVDATTEVPAGYTPEGSPKGDFGWGAVAIPGTVAGLTELHTRFGSLPLATVLDPAIRLAREGVTLTEGEAGRFASAAEDLAKDPGASAHFLGPDGSPFPAGAVLVQATLASTLESIARGGADVFYRGDLARTAADEMKAHGGWVTAADLDAYRPRPSIVVQGAYRDLDLIGTYLPASGATTIEALQILEHFDLSGADPAERIGLLASALSLSFYDREAATGTPTEIAKRLTSAEWAARRAEDARTFPIPSVSRDGEPSETTHLSVVDLDGNAVSLTQSLGPTGGARVASPGLGFLYASTLGYLDDIQPGDRPWSSQSPIIATRDGELALVIGGAGARRIISALVSVITRLADEGLELEDALAAPRLHVDAAGIALERPGPENGRAQEQEEFAAMTRALDDLEIAWNALESGVFFARLNAVAIDPTTGERIGVADPRWPWSGASGPIR